jgi:hypothetical protein
MKDRSAYIGCVYIYWVFVNIWSSVNCIYVTKCMTDFIALGVTEDSSLGRVKYHVNTFLTCALWAPKLSVSYSEIMHHSSQDVFIDADHSFHASLLELYCSCKQYPEEKPIMRKYVVCDLQNVVVRISLNQNIQKSIKRDWILKIYIENIHHCMRYEVHRAVNIEVTGLLDAMPCTLVDRYKNFRGTYCFQLLHTKCCYLCTRLYGITSQKTVILSQCFICWLSTVVLKNPQNWHPYLRGMEEITLSGREVTVSIHTIF